MEFYIVRFLHMLGMALWAGGLVGISVAASKLETEEAPRLAGKLRNALRKVSTPGLLLTWIGGLGMLLPHFAELYKKAGWMHTKLLLLVVLTALSGITGAKLRKISEGALPYQASTFHKLGISSLLVIIAIVILATFRPGA